MIQLPTGTGKEPCPTGHCTAGDSCGEASVYRRSHRRGSIAVSTAVSADGLVRGLRSGRASRSAPCVIDSDDLCDGVATIQAACCAGIAAASRRASSRQLLAPVNAALLSEFPLAIGTSATPWSAGCLRFFDGNRHTYGLSESIAAGHNAPTASRAGAPQAVDSPIIYASTGDDLREICQALRASDYAIYQRRNARQVIQRYRHAILKAIVVRRMLTEGFDNPQCKAVYIARDTQSRIAAMQMAGRALRPHKGKTATIFVPMHRPERG